MSENSHSREYPLVTESETTRTIHVIVSKDPATIAKARSEERAKALRRGDAIVEEDGTRIYRTRSIVYGPDHREVFHADGDRVKCQWTETTVRPDGQHSARELRAVWVSWDAAHRAEFGY